MVGRWSSAFGLHDLGEVALRLQPPAPAAESGGGRGAAAAAGGAGEFGTREASIVLRVEVTLVRATVLVCRQTEHTSHRVSSHPISSISPRPHHNHPGPFPTPHPLPCPPPLPPPPFCVRIPLPADPIPGAFRQ